MQTNEQVVEVDGLSIGLRFDFNAIDRVHKATGINMLDPKAMADAREVEEAATPEQVIEIVWACYVAYHDWREEDVPLSKRKFRGINIPVLYAALKGVQEDAMPEPEEGDETDPTPAPSGETVGAV